jgi:hypothetical protein
LTLIHIFFQILQGVKAKYELILKKFIHNEGYEYDASRGLPIYAKLPQKGSKGKLNITDVIEQSENFLVVKGVKPSTVVSNDITAPNISRIQILREKAAKKQIEDEKARFV